MAVLSVNINKVATLRNSRGKDTPNLLKMTTHLLNLGVKGITIHPRPDERHIKQSDVWDLKQFLSKYADIEFNIEGYPSTEFLNLISEVKPHQCTLVPDPPHVLTSNAGWDVLEQFATLEPVIKKLKALEVRSSIFIDPTTFNKEQFEQLLKLKPERVELYTESFADDFINTNNHKSIKHYATWAQQIKDSGIGINAGHDLNQANLNYFLTEVPQVDEVSIGHAIFSEALYDGVDKTIQTYLKICKR